MNAAEDRIAPRNFRERRLVAEARAPLEAQLSTLREAHEESERLLDRIEQRAALLPIGFDGGASRKTLRLQGVMFAHWISEQRAEMVLAERRMTGQGGAEPPPWPVDAPPRGADPAWVPGDGDPCQRLREAHEEMRKALEHMAWQFAYWDDGTGGHTTGGLSALEDAFEVLGWDDPHPAPEGRCDEPGCMKQATCGWPTRPGGTGPNGGYRHTCGDHMRSARLLAADEEARAGQAWLRQLAELA